MEYPTILIEHILKNQITRPKNVFSKRIQKINKIFHLQSISYVYFIFDADILYLKFMAQIQHLSLSGP